MLRLRSMIMHNLRYCLGLLNKADQMQPPLTLSAILQVLSQLGMTLSVTSPTFAMSTCLVLVL